MERPQRTSKRLPPNVSAIEDVMEWVSADRNAKGDSHKADKAAKQRHGSLLRPAVPCGPTIC
jgi:hypothetical protein